MSNYMQEFSAELRRRLPGMDRATGETIHWVMEKVLESYRNGQRDCRKCSPRPRREAKR